VSRFVGGQLGVQDGIPYGTQGSKQCIAGEEACVDQLSGDFDGVVVLGDASDDAEEVVRGLIRLNAFAERKSKGYCRGRSGGVDVMRGYAI
jgi:hypothetical protein